ncbi:hypothetical protein [Glaesserella sp.]|uniref:hypothetical protein n=1 Tax=Glaesserella sp. TaxID=2094731 RepID=UPI00359F4278
MFNGWELIAQQDGYFKHDLRSNEKTWTEETHYAVSQPNGQVLALFNPQGKRVWRKQPTSLWGLPLLNHWERKQQEPINPNMANLIESFFRLMKAKLVSHQGLSDEHKIMFIKNFIC